MHGPSGMPILSSLLQCELLPLPVDDCVSVCVLLGLRPGLTHSFSNDRTILLSQLFGPVFLLLSKVWEFLDLCLVQAVDDGILALCDVDALDLLLIFEADLAGGHAAVLL